MNTVQVCYKTLTQVHGFLLIELRQTASRPAINTIFLPYSTTFLLIYDQFNKMKYVFS